MSLNRIGSIVAPTVVGRMLDSYGPRVLPIQQLVCCVGLFVFLNIVVLLVKKSVQYIDNRRKFLATEPKVPVDTAKTVNTETETSN